MTEIQYKNRILCDKYPWLIPHNCWTGKILDNYDYSYTELDDMPDGWRAAFGQQMCEEIQLILDKLTLEDSNNFRIIQIKEKWGRLYFSTNWSTEKIRHIIDKYEEISAHTCIECGAPAKYQTQGYILPFCENCCPKNQIVTPI